MTSLGSTLGFGAAHSWGAPAAAVAWSRSYLPGRLLGAMRETRSSHQPGLPAPSLTLSTQQVLAGSAVLFRGRHERVHHQVAAVQPGRVQPPQRRGGGRHQLGGEGWGRPPGPLPVCALVRAWGLGWAGLRAATARVWARRGGGRGGWRVPAGSGRAAGQPTAGPIPQFRTPLRRGRSLDCELKQFRLAGDALMEGGAALELSTVLMPRWFLPLACTGVCGGAALCVGATRWRRAGGRACIVVVLSSNRNATQTHESV